jgi:hypothetical protein
MARKLTLGQMSKLERFYHPTLKESCPLSPFQLTQVQHQGLHLTHDLKQDHDPVANYPGDPPIKVRKWAEIVNPRAVRLLQKLYIRLRETGLQGLHARD